MSRISKSSGMSPLGRAVQELNTIIAQRGADFASAEMTDRVLSMESLDDRELQELKYHSDEIKEVIRETFRSCGMESLSDAQLEAGVIAASAAGNPLAYAERGYAMDKISTEGVSVFEPIMSGQGGQMDFRNARSMEAFDEKELRNGIAFSTGFNVQAARQSAFAEALYPTYVLSPDQAYLDITVKRPVVYNEFRHATSGRAADFKQRNLVEACIDATILADNATACIPVVLADNSNLDYFAPAALYTPVVRKQSGVDVTTAPLVMNKDIDLIGISTVPGLVGNGIMTNTDALDSRLSLEALYLRAPNVAGDDIDFIKFDVSRLPRNAFSKTVEGQYRELGLQFRTESLLLTKDTVNVDGAAPSVLAAIKTNDWVVRLKVNVDGTANVQFGNVNVYASGLTVMSILNSAGQEVSLTSGAGLTLVQDLARATFGHYDINATRTNSNRRTSGLQADVTEFTNRHPIPLGSPLSAPAPVTAPRDGTDLQVLTAMARTRNTNQAITTLLNYGETLKAYVAAVANGAMPEIEGAGRYLLKEAFYEEIDLDLEAQISSLTSSDRAADISALLVDTIREVAYRMFTDTGYQAALDLLTGGASQLPELFIGTDPKMIRHLMISGDTRTAGIGFKANIVSDLDSRVENKIFLTFTRPEAAAGPDPLSWGTHAWIPELASVVNVNKDGATIRQSMVQPRNRHINHLPILAVINVTGLKAALTSKATINNHVVA